MPNDQEMQARGVELRSLSMEECRAYLALVKTGNLAVTYRAMPSIVPVRVDGSGDELIVESLLGTAIPLYAGSVVALSCGTIGGGPPVTGWTVEVRGFLNPIESAAARNLLLLPDLGVFRLSTDVISGWSR